MIKSIHDLIYKSKLLKCLYLNYLYWCAQYIKKDFGGKLLTKMKLNHVIYCGHKQKIMQDCNSYNLFNIKKINLRNYFKTLKLMEKMIFIYKNFLMK